MKLITVTGLALVVVGIVYLFLGLNQAFSDTPFAIALALFVLAAVSFGLGRIKIPKKVGVAISVVFIVGGILVPAAWAFSPASIGTDLAYLAPLTVTGSFVVPSGPTNGTMDVKVINSGQNSPDILGLNVTNVGPDYRGPIPNNNIGSVAMTYHGNPVSPSNPLPGGATATASIEVSQVVNDSVYTILVSYVSANQARGVGSYEVPPPESGYTSKNAVELSLADGSKVCPDSLGGSGVASWSGETCTISPGSVSPTLCIQAQSGTCDPDPMAELVIDRGVVLELIGGVSLTVYGTLDNFGTINADVATALLTDNGTINNFGTIAVQQFDISTFSGDHGLVENFNGSIINDGTLQNLGLIVNYGTIQNDGQISECTQTSSAVTCGTMEGAGITQCPGSCTTQTSMSETESPTNTTSRKSST